MSQYLIILEKSADSDWGAYVLDLPGCVAVGETRDEAAKLIREAIGLHSAGIREDGEPIPEPSATSELYEPQSV